MGEHTRGALATSQVNDNRKTVCPIEASRRVYLKGQP